MKNAILIGTVLLLVAGGGFGFANAATAQQVVEIQPRPDIEPQPIPPRVILRFCIRRLELTTVACVNANTEVTDHCVRLIRHLIATGHRDQAIAVARKCKRFIRSNTSSCVDKLVKICEDCATAIHNAGGGRALLRQLKQICHREIGRARTSGDESCRRILEALGLDTDVAG